jgi:immunoglobulin-binding protein 1
LLDLATLNDRIAALSLFSPNEQLEDISTTDLIYLIVPYVYAEVQGRVRTTGRDERLLVLGHLQVGIILHVSD